MRLTVSRRELCCCLQAISINVHKPGRLSRRAEQGAVQIGKIYVLIRHKSYGQRDFFFIRIAGFGGGKEDDVLTVKTGVVKVTWRDGHSRP